MVDSNIKVLIIIHDSCFARVIGDNINKVNFVATYFATQLMFTNTYVYMYTYKYVHAICIYVDKHDEASRYTRHSNKVSYIEE